MARPMNRLYRGPGSSTSRRAHDAFFCGRRRKRCLSEGWKPTLRLFSSPFGKGKADFRRIGEGERSSQRSCAKPHENAAVF